MIEKLLSDYEYHYGKLLALKPRYIEEYILSNDLEMGVSFYAKRKWGVDISKEKWVKQHIISGDDYWCRYPITLCNNKCRLKSINRRIQILKIVKNEKETFSLLRKPLQNN